MAFNGTFIISQVSSCCILSTFDQLKSRNCKIAISVNGEQCCYIMQMSR